MVQVYDIVETTQYPHNAQRWEVIGICKGHPKMAAAIPAGTTVRNGATIVNLVYTSCEKVDENKGSKQRAKALAMLHSKDSAKRLLGAKLLKALKK